MECPDRQVAYPDITLGILAGGRATRLGGIDKAWLQRDGVPQVLWLRDMFDSRVATTFVSVNRNLQRYTQYGLPTMTDRVIDAGPLAGMDALLAACDTPWLLTFPVDVVAVPPDLIERLVAGGKGAFVEDDDGVQPLIALWSVAKTRVAVEEVLASRTLAVQELQTRLDMRPERFRNFQFGNLNMPADLDAAGIKSEMPSRA